MTECARGRCWLLCAALLTPLAAALAEVPQVAFDMPYAVACRDVTPPQFAAAHPGRTLIEARLEISALLIAGQERDLTQFFIRIENPARPLAVVDYLPKTQHESRLAGPVTITDTQEKSATLGINFSGKYEVISAVGPTIGVGQKKTSCVKYDLLPPLDAVAASGTLNRASSVFFKLKATPRHPLEGARQYGLVLQVPATWRNECLRVRCEAEGIRRGPISAFDEEASCGRREFVVALYLDGDEPARLAAERFARRQAQAPIAKLKDQSSQESATWSLSAPWEMLRR